MADEKDELLQRVTAAIRGTNPFTYAVCPLEITPDLNDFIAANNMDLSPNNVTTFVFMRDAAKILPEVQELKCFERGATVTVGRRDSRRSYDIRSASEQYLQIEAMRLRPGNEEKVKQMVDDVGGDESAEYLAAAYQIKGTDLTKAVVHLVAASQAGELTKENVKSYCQMYKLQLEGDRMRIIAGWLAQRSPEFYRENIVIQEAKNNTWLSYRIGAASGVKLAAQAVESAQKFFRQNEVIAIQAANEQFWSIEAAHKIPDRAMVVAYLFHKHLGALPDHWYQAERALASYPTGEISTINKGMQALAKLRSSAIQTLELKSEEVVEQLVSEGITAAQVASRLLREDEYRRLDAKMERLAGLIERMKAAGKDTRTLDEQYSRMLLDTLDRE